MPAMGTGTALMTRRWSENSQSITDADVTRSMFVSMQSIDMRVEAVILVASWTLLAIPHGSKSVFLRCWKTLDA